MPHNLAAIDFLRRERPELPQVACFDTAFHRSMPLCEQVYALPHEWLAKGSTPLDGIPMATRPGALDSGVVTWLIREAELTPAAVDDMLNHHSGLLGLSGTSDDMRELLQDPRPDAADAIDYFVHHTQRAIASLAGAMGGQDALVFTAGIGENAPAIRERICRKTAWLGIELDLRQPLWRRPPCVRCLEIPPLIRIARQLPQMA